MLLCLACAVLTRVIETSKLLDLDNNNNNNNVTLRTNTYRQSRLLFMISWARPHQNQNQITHGQCWYAWYIQNQHKLCHHKRHYSSQL